MHQRFGNDAAVDQSLPHGFEDQVSVVFVNRLASEKPPGRPAAEHVVLDVESLYHGSQDVAAVDPGKKVVVVLVHIIHCNPGGKRPDETA